jgi:hypothetical protein
MDMIRTNAPKAHSPASSFVIGITCMTNQEKFADRSGPAGVCARREKKSKGEK